MARVFGFTRAELLAREQVFERLTAKAVRSSVRKLTADVQDVITAAAAEASTESNPTFSAAELNTVTVTWQQHVASELYPYLVQTFLDSAAETYGSLEDVATKSIPKVDYDFARSHLIGAANRLVGIGDTIWSDMRAQLTTGYEAGESIGQLAARLRAVAKISEPHAIMIARTEVVPAANYASLYQMELAGFTDEECSKRWLATEDARTRPEHLAADGQTVPLSKPFSVGGELLNYPGDWSAGATPDNVINCRCSLDYVFHDDENEPLKAAGDSDWIEAQHPRDAAGKFAEKATSKFPKSLVEHGSATSLDIWLSGLSQESFDKFTYTEKKALSERIKFFNDPSLIAEHAKFEAGIKGKKAVKFSPDVVYHGTKHDMEEWLNSLDSKDYQGFTYDQKSEINKSIAILGNPPELVDKQNELLTGIVKSTSVTPSTAFDEDVVKNGLPHEFGHWLDNLSQSDYDSFTDEQRKLIEVKYKSDSHPYATVTKYHQLVDNFKSKDVKSAHPIVIKEMTEVSTGKPIKINTNVIYKQKYSHGAVIAEKLTDFNVPIRLTWNEHKKKFVTERRPLSSATWFPVEEYGKGEAYKKFSQETGWNVPGTLNFDKPKPLAVVKPDTTVPDTPNVPSGPAAAAPAAATGSKYHLDVHAKMKPVSEIGTPGEGVKNFKTLTPTQAVVVHNGMFTNSGKTLTSAHIDAVQRYTTSVGYQTTNAVLRDDASRLKMFTAAQLNDGVKNAVDLQDVMTPLPLDVRVFRGTGAHAFGQKSIAANFTELKKLEGKTLTDKGFISTTVLDKPPVAYDYANKPIQMIVDAPAGTPAAYVSAITPGWSQENELILGAGSSYHVKEVREATAADKAQFGSGVQHVVHVQIVPSTGKSSHAIKSPTDAGKTPKPASVTAPAAPTPPSAPASTIKVTHHATSAVKTQVKLNTNAIYKQKYVHGAVIAVKNHPDGEQERLIWNEHSKKFVRQSRGDSSDPWQVTQLYGKGEAYKKFSGENDWFAPAPGESAIGSLGFPGAAPTISYIPASAVDTPSVPTPTTTADVKKPKLSAAMLQAMYGDVPAAVTNQNRFNIHKQFKGVPGSITLNSPPAEVFKRLEETRDWWNANKGPTQPELNLLQLLRVIDEKSTPPSVGLNSYLYEKKIVEWLKSPSGASAVKNAATAPSSVAVGGTPAAVLKNLKSPSEIGTITTGKQSYHFLPVNTLEAQSMQNSMLQKQPWTAAEKTALQAYTGSNFTQMNEMLRGLSLSGYNSPETKLKYAKNIVNAQNGMRPAERNIKVFRATDGNQFPGLKSHAQFGDIKAFEGKLITDKGFMSTSVTEGTWTGNVRITIEVPEGTPMAYVKKISNHPDENEVVLAAGLKYRVVSVSSGYGYTIANVVLRVEP